MSGLMYERLAQFITEGLDLANIRVILEAGCGTGHLTLPLLRKLSQTNRDFRYVAYDLFAGPYEGNLKDFEKMLQEERLQKSVTVIQGRVENMEKIEDESVDLVVSNELFPDLNRSSLQDTLQEFYRILKPNGQMAHGELNPVAENKSQSLLIESDSHSLKTMQPSPEWFSPYVDEVSALMHKTGFKDIVVKYFETKVKMDFSEALEQLKKWKVDPVFIEQRKEDFKKFGLELPMEHVIFCTK